MYTAMKIIREPLLDVNGIDFGTGKYNKEAHERQTHAGNAMIEKQKEKAQKFLETAPRNAEGKIFVNWLWRC